MTDTIKYFPFGHVIIDHQIPEEHDAYNDTICGTRKFHIFLKTCLGNHYQYLVFLFHHPIFLETVYGKAVKIFGIFETLKIIQECIPANNSLPILHHVMKNDPECMTEFTSRYSSAVYLCDNNRRSFVQAQLEEGKKTLDNNGLFFLRLSDDDIVEANPVTNKYPFLTMASG